MRSSKASAVKPNASWSPCALVAAWARPACSRCSELAMTSPDAPWSPTVSPETFLAMGREVLAKQPFSVLIGAELQALSPGQCELHVPVSDSIRQQHGFVHGGVVSYAADNALTYAGGTAMRVPVVTSEFKINYLRPAVGERLIARAHAVHHGKSQAVC